MSIFLVLDIQTQVDFGSNVLQYLTTHLKEFFSLTPIMKKQKHDHESVQCFQNKWVAHLPWEIIMVHNIGNVHQVHCAICSRVESKEKLLGLKFNNLLKHVSDHKTKVLVQS
jgi:hypothetical protein